MSEKVRKKGGKYSGLVNVIRTELTVLANMAVIYIAMNLPQFAHLKKELFVKVLMVLLGVTLFLNILMFLSVRFHKLWLRIISDLVLAAVIISGGYGTWAMKRVNTDIDMMTETTKIEDVNANIIVFSKASVLISDVSDLEGKKIGIIPGTHVAELTKKRLSEAGIHCEYVEYNDYESVGISLVNEIVDAIALGNNFQSQFSNEDTLCDFVDDLNVITVFNDTQTVVHESGSEKDLTKEPFTVLLIGDSSGLSDTIMIVSINPQSMRATMTSIARDSYVPITCYGGGSSKINASHAVSVECLISTVEQLTGVDIDYYFEVNFQGVVDVVEALGGIRVSNHTEFLGQTYTDKKGFHRVEMPLGDNVLYNGEQALAWVRERKAFPDGDFARQRHQQEFIRIVLKDVMQTRNVNTFLDLMDAAGTNIKTNLSIDQITKFLTYVMKKAERYYNQDSLGDVFLITGWRITGYSAMKYDAGLNMDLYIYRLWNSAISASRDLIEKNLEMASFNASHTVDWGAKTPFTEPVIVLDYYKEAKVSDETKAQVEASQSSQSNSGTTSETPSQPSENTEPEQPQVVEPTPEPAPTVEPTPEPAPAEPDSPTPEPEVEPAPAEETTE